MDTVIFRPACPQDALEIAQLTIIAGGGVFEFLLEDFTKENISLENFLESEIKKETGELSYQNTEVAELNNKIIGIIKSSDAKKYGISEEMKELFSSEKLDWLKDSLSIKLEEGLYINFLAVNNDYRKQGIGTKLINHVKNKAKQQNISLLSLMVWCDNLTAIEFYKRQGFKDVKHINVDFHPLMPHHGGMKLMQCLLENQ
ncbi:MAG: GNAT family N-acetyltransferase [Crocosphaera sp.]|nr:GNAT family N-acetyltransferase [Crocosphaera sp.]